MILRPSSRLRDELDALYEKAGFKSANALAVALIDSAMEILRDRTEVPRVPHRLLATRATLMGATPPEREIEPLTPAQEARVQQLIEARDAERVERLVQAALAKRRGRQEPPEQTQ